MLSHSCSAMCHRSEEQRGSLRFGYAFAPPTPEMNCSLLHDDEMQIVGPTHREVEGGARAAMDGALSNRATRVAQVEVVTLEVDVSDALRQRGNMGLSRLPVGEDDLSQHMLADGIHWVRHTVLELSRHKFALPESFSL